MGGKSKSKQSTQTTTHNESNVNNIALSGIEDGGAGVLGDDNMSNTGSAYDGSVLVTGENNNVTVTDGGAFGLVESVAYEAMDGVNKTAENAIFSNEYITGRSMDFAASAGEEALGFGNSAMDFVESITLTAIDGLTDLSKESVSESNAVFTESLNTVAGAVTDLQQTEATGGQSEIIIKGLYVVGGVSAIALLAKAFGGSKAA